ncbi:MAG: transposase [SAR324 cluster bacterium]|nr:transposase [SAR324 cluster bacterium]
MARKPRIHFQNAFYHVILRGNGGQTIFFEEDDYRYFEKLLREGIQRYGHRLHGYCWMPNHVHMVIQVADVPLSKIMQNLSFRYTRWFNHRQQRIGHLFQGRYKAILIDEDQYLWELLRYIHLNPVRARLVERPEDFRWSAHLCYLGKIAQEWVTTDWVLPRFSKQAKRARKKYEAYVLEGIGEERRLEFHQGNLEGRILGDDEFLQSIPLQHKDPPKIFSQPIDLEQLTEHCCKFFGIAPEQLKTRRRTRKESRIRTLIALLYSENSGTLQEAAEFFQRDISTLSRQVSLLLKQTQADEQKKQEVEKIKTVVYTKMQA